LLNFEHPAKDWIGKLKARLSCVAYARLVRGCFARSALDILFVHPKNILVVITDFKPFWVGNLISIILFERDFDCPYRWSWDSNVITLDEPPIPVGSRLSLFVWFTEQLRFQVTLSEKFLVSVCSEYNHVRTWSVTRFRGMISTQPGSTPVASFKIVALEEVEPYVSYAAGNDCGKESSQKWFPTLLYEDQCLLFTLWQVRLENKMTSKFSFKRSCLKLRSCLFDWLPTENGKRVNCSPGKRGVTPEN